MEGTEIETLARCRPTKILLVLSRGRRRSVFVTDKIKLMPVSVDNRSFGRLSNGSAAWDEVERQNP